MSLYTNLCGFTYIELQKLDYISNGKLTKILNDNGVPNLTVCPQCKVDDFVHVVGCSYQPSAWQIAKWTKLSKQLK